MSKSALLLLLPALVVLFFGCQDDSSPRFELLTTPVWESDSLLVNGTGAGGTGQMLEGFNGTVDFQTDGTVYIVEETGSWNFMQNETQLMIQSPEIPFPLIVDINELSHTSLKISTNLPNLQDPQATYHVRMTFRAK